MKENELPEIGTPEYALLEAKLRAEINALRPDKRFYAGRQFFNLLLDEQKIAGVYRFLARANAALSKNGELEVADFDDDEALDDIFMRSRIKMLTRRAAMGVIAEGAGGAALAAYGVAGAADQWRGTQNHSASTNPDSWEASVDKVMPYAYVAIGASMMDASYRHNQEYKLGDIANAVTRLIDRLPETSQREKAQRRGIGIKGLSC